MKMKSGKALTDILHRTARSAGLDTDRRYLLEMNSEGNLKITGIRDIKDYNESSILVSTEIFINEIRGSGLLLEQFSDSQICVRGEVTEIKFIKR